jgi:hypothetical protein
MNKFNSDNKKLIRADWAKPIIAFIKDELNKKLLYLGLPDSNAHDIVEWLEYIDAVYAFQCRKYPQPSNPEQSREKILALENTLRVFERKRQLTTFDVFDGYIEEVILRGFDNSPTIKEFAQQDVITLYNLDFCGQVTSPIEYKDRNGNLQKAFKFDAIKRLLDLQKQISFPNKKFIMFLTLHCSYDGKELSIFIDNPQNTDIQTYLAQVSSFSKGKKAPYLVKAFVLHFLQQFFLANEFIAEVLPTIHYIGDNNNPILFFTILGTSTQSKSAGGIVHYQKLSEILNHPFIEISDNAFIKSTSFALSNDMELDSNLNPLHLFKKSKTYKNLWNK